MEKERKTDKGYHIKDFPEEARKLAKAGAILEGMSVGEWIAGAVRDRWRRSTSQRRAAGRPERNGLDTRQERMSL